MGTEKKVTSATTGLQVATKKMDVDDKTDLSDEDTYQISSSSDSCMNINSKIKPQSDIPKIPLAKLFNNATLFTDHFDQYAGSVYQPLEDTYGRRPKPVNFELNDSDVERPTRHEKQRKKKEKQIICAAAPLINPTPLHVCEVIDGADGLQNGLNLDGLILGPDLEPVEPKTLGAALPNGRLVSAAEFAAKTNSLRPVVNRKDWQPRRRTLPILLTQEPLQDVARNPFKPASRNLLERRKRLERKSALELNHPPFGQMPPVGRERELTPGITKLPKCSALNESQVYHIVEDGVRKRLHKKPNSTLGQVMGYPYAPKDDEELLSPLMIPTESSHVEVRSNVIVNSPQDELPFLPASFMESLTDLSKECQEMNSMLDVRVCGKMPEESGIAPAELITLNQISQRQRAEEWTRKQEGEIVIRMSDFFVSFSRFLSVLSAGLALAQLFLDLRAALQPGAGLFLSAH
ncbi:hypothetical protein Ciccas_013482 [Cichlidogyrus casuarinus]|uniref:Uncharacterized protein n=1 Tax=Cichlidogyrus casuarinus TaxID=1844966 RepID=A0ABD2PLQ6_9PLAT